MDVPAKSSTHTGAAIDREVRRELLAHAVAQAVGSGSAFIVATSIVVALAVWHGRYWAALVIICAATGLWFWRKRIAARVADPRCLASLHRLQWMFSINMMLSGVVWVIALATIFPYLPIGEAVLLLLIIVGAMVVALPVCSMVDWALELYVVPQLVAAVAVCLAMNLLDAPILVAAACLFAFVLMRASRHYRDLGRDAVMRRAASESANTALREANAHIARTNAELQDAMHSAQAAAVAKTRFLANMSHEIRTPINGVLGALELLERHELQPHVRELVEVADRSGRALLGVLNEVLDYARVETRQPAVHREPIALHELLASVHALFHASMHAKGLTTTLEIHPRVPHTILGDALCLRQVLMNLIGNAVKFTSAGSVVVRADVIPGATATLVIEIIDTGIGISAEDQARLFTPFFQADSSDTRAFGGAGLGLAFSKRMVDAMGGVVSLHSALGEGTSIRIELPCVTEEEASPVVAHVAATAPTAANERAAAPIDGASVLLVEDNEVNRLVASEMLFALGLDVREAVNGREAVEAQLRAPAAIVLMDCQMPEMDGFEATRRIREHERTGRLAWAPIIAVTAHVLDGDAERCRAAGMDDYLAKPYGLDDLRAKIERWLPRRS